MSLPEKIDTILSSYLSQRGYLSTVKEQNVASKWKDFVGEEIAKNSRCEKVENGILYVTTISSSWRQELSFLKKDIIERINGINNSCIIKDIIFL